MTDRYTRIVLTVIAACLVLIVARDIELVPTAQAVEQPVRCQGDMLQRTQASDYVRTGIFRDGYRIDIQCR